MTEETALLPAQPLHAAALAAIHAESLPAGPAWGSDAISLQLGLPGSFGFLHPGGGMVLGRVAAGEAEVLTLAVAPPARGGGIGATLLAAAMREAARRGASALFLEVSGANAAARALYQRAGFVPVGRRPRYYADGNDALVMRAALIALSEAGGG